MANFGSLDYDLEETVDYTSLHRRIKTEDSEAMLQWPMDQYAVQSGYGFAEVQQHCVKDASWQQTRLSMKGLPTHMKLEVLKNWWDNHADTAIAEIQVGNYLGALVRGGQLQKRTYVIRKYL